jgi:hypothetical protein
MIKEQRILLLIIKHDYKQPFLITNRKLKCLDWTLCLQIKNKTLYSYMYKDILSLKIDDFLKDLGIKTKIM